MLIKEKLEELELYHLHADEEGRGGDFREDLADEMIRFLKAAKHPTLHGLLDHLLGHFSETYTAGNT